MENDLLAIGAMATRSGLPVSALRFYDGAGVLPPSVVDPSTGYRFYRPDQVRLARIVAHLRRVGLPLADIRTVVEEPGEAATVLAAHLARLEAGLTDARREISIVHDLLTTPETLMYRCTLPAPQLLAALREVRYAASADPTDERLHGVYLDSEPGRLRLVATDRYRLATVTVDTPEQTDLHVLLPLTVVDELLGLTDADRIDLTLEGDRLNVTGRGVDLTAPVPEVDFPSYRSMLGHGRREVPVDTRALRAELEAAPSVADPADTGAPVSLLTVGRDDVRVGESVDGSPDAVVVAVNRDYLLEALDAGAQLTLGIDDPIAPLAVRDPRREGAMSLVMPIRRDALA